MPLLWLKARLLAVAAGLLFLHVLPVIWPRSVSFPLLLLSVLALISGSLFFSLPRLSAASTRWYWFSLPLCALLGLCWSQYQAGEYLTRRFDTDERVELSFQGIIASIPQHQGERLRFIVRSDEEESALHSHCPYPCQIRLDWYRASVLPRSGERWSFTAQLSAPQGPLNHAGFDAERQALLQHWHAQGVVLGQQGQKINVASPIPMGIADEVTVLRQRNVNWLERQFSAPVAAVLSALLLGERGSLSAQLWDQLAATGTSHLLAISGLHVGLVGAIAYLCVLLLGRSLARFWPQFLDWMPLQHWAAAGAIPLAASYAMLAGFQVSTRRALAMLVVASAIVFLRRQRDPWLIYLWALVLVLVAEPVASLGAGFGLSFAAVACLIYGFHRRAMHLSPHVVGGRKSALRVRPETSRWMSWLERVLVLVKAQALVSLGLLPLTLLYFQQFSLIGPLVNLWAVPWVSVCLLPLGLLGLVVHNLGGDWPWLWWLLENATLILLQSLHWAAQWPWAEWHWGVPIWAAILALCGVIHILAPRGIPLRSLGWLWCLPLCFPRASGPLDGELWLYQYDVGQGSALALRTANHLMLYDTGPGDGAGHAWFEAAVLPSLRLLQRPDLLMLSHADLDHAGGLTSAREQLQPRHEVASYPPFRPCLREQRWVWDGIEFLLLHPGAHLPYLGNDSSCVLLVRRVNTEERAAILLPGDLGVHGERAVLQYWQDHREQLRSQVLVLGHHGSRGSSSAEWLDAVAPSWALLSRSRHNRFGFPHPEVVERLQARGIQWLDSANCGGILLRFGVDGHLLDPEPEANAARIQRRWWRRPAVNCPQPALD